MVQACLRGIVPVPRNHNEREENTAIKAGRDAGGLG